MLDKNAFIWCIKLNFPSRSSKDSIFRVLTCFTFWAIVRKVLRAESPFGHKMIMGSKGLKWVGLWGCGPNGLLEIVKKPKSCKDMTAAVLKKTRIIRVKRGSCGIYRKIDETWWCIICDYLSNNEELSAWHVITSWPLHSTSSIAFWRRRLIDEKRSWVSLLWEIQKWSNDSNFEKVGRFWIIIQLLIFMLKNL